MVMMSKKIIVCSDGTSKTAYQHGPLTNVSRISRCIRQEDDEKRPQMLFYQTGIGTDIDNMSRLNLIKQGLGLGIENKIIEAYAFICHNYNKADHIILIGFSRGAFIMRCVADLVCKVGILKKNGLFLLPEIFRVWKEGNEEPLCSLWQETEGNMTVSRWFERVIPFWKSSPQPDQQHDQQKLTLRQKLQGEKGVAEGVKIKACVLWDTVSSLGTPWPRFFRPRRSNYLSFVDSNLRGIDFAYQALALHESRWNFSPIVWRRDLAVSPTNNEDHDNSMDRSGEITSTTGLEETHDTDFEQCWFLGYHADIGGGRREDALGHIALAWVAGKLDSVVGIDWDMFWDPEANIRSSWKIRTSNTLAMNVRSSMKKRYLFMGSQNRIPCCYFYDYGKGEQHGRSDEWSSSEKIHPTVRFLVSDNEGTGHMRCPPSLKNIPVDDTVPWNINHPISKESFEVAQCQFHKKELAKLKEWIERELDYLQHSAKSQQLPPKTAISAIKSEIDFMEYSK